MCGELEKNDKESLSIADIVQEVGLIVEAGQIRAAGCRFTILKIINSYMYMYI